MLRGDKTPRARLARSRITRVCALNRQIRALTGEITQPAKDSGTTLTSIRGIRALGAAEIIVQTGNVERDPAKARLRDGQP